MNLNKVFANYKVYGIVIGAIIGIIVYNTIAIDFFARREEIIYTEQLINIFIIMLCNNMKRYIFIFKYVQSIRIKCCTNITYGVTNSN